MKRVIVHVDSLWLNGFRREDRHAFAAGLQQELGRAFADAQLVSRLTEGVGASRLSAGSVHVAQGALPRGVGASVARGVGKRLAK